MVDHYTNYFGIRDDYRIHYKTDGTKDQTAGTGKNRTAETQSNQLPKFSWLLRLVLDESYNNLISLKDEVKLPDPYLQLESLRFDSAFSYNLHIDENLDEEEIMLPSFLIHAIIENAIWHGLLHQAGERRLIIQFCKKGRTGVTRYDKG